ncbi:MAG: DinB family protein [bacterium]
MSSSKRKMILDVHASSAKPLFAVLDGIPAEQLNWKPAPESRSIGDICRHLIRVDAWFLKRLGVPPVAGVAKPVTSEEISEGMRQIQRQVKEVVLDCGHDEELFFERASLDGKDREQLGVAVLHMAQHYLYHLAQIIYLRRAQDRNWPSPHEDWDHATHVIGDYLLGMNEKT